MKSFKEYLTESNTALLSWSSSNWWVHFYNESQIETHWETGEKVSRSGAIVFTPYDKPDVDNLMNLSAWKQTIEFPVGYMISFELGKSICDDKNIDKIEFLKAYEE